MKQLLVLMLMVCLQLLINPVKAQQQKADSLGLPGDNLNLYAVLKLFQESATLEGFEKSLNDEHSKINNMDLDGDDKIDYIMVNDEVDGNAHSIVLQIAVNATEKQDVAVFTVEKDDKNQVQIQLIGDEELYGKDYIIEPNFETGDAVKSGETPNPGYTGDQQKIEGQPVVVTKTTTVEIATWPIVQFIYVPTYYRWHSPWYWGYYPSYWNPWKPYYWHYYYGYHYNWYHHYYGHYRRSYYHRYNHWNDFYYNNRRNRSPYVYNRRQTGVYRNTYSKPALRREGENLYKKTNPGKPVFSRPATKPALTRPASKPTPSPDRSRPAVKPASNTSTTRPALRPPVTRPLPTQKPNPKPAPTSRPSSKPSFKPAPKQPNRASVNSRL